MKTTGWLVAPGGVTESRLELGEETLFGREPSNTVQIQAGDVSRRHARITRRKDGRYVLEDLGSTNGTFVNAERIQSHVLQPGDEIRIGPRLMVFAEEDCAVDPQDIEVAVSGTDENVIGLECQPGEFLPVSQVTDPEALRRDYERLRVAHEISRAIAGELDPDKFLPRILDLSMSLLRADRGVILLADGSGEFVPRYVRQRNAKVSTIPISKTVLSMAMSQRKAVLSSDMREDDRFSLSASVVNLGIRSSMTVPLLHGELLLGAIHLNSTVFSNSFKEKDLEILMAIATQAATALRNAQLALKLQNEAQTRTELQRLIPPNVVEQVVSGRLSLDRGGKLSKVTMLYADIRGFTAMSERTAPEEIVRMLNEYYELMVEAVFNAQGTVDKFVGDQIIALFGAPIESPDAPFFAVNCALEMQKALRDWNERRAASGLEPIHAGIGINAGPVITGAIGSSRTVQYTAIGDAMNTASRLCEIAGPDEILISSAVYARVAQFVETEPCDPVELRGKSGRVVVHRVLGPRVSLDRTVG